MVLRAGALAVVVLPLQEQEGLTLEALCSRLPSKFWSTMCPQQGYPWALLPPSTSSSSTASCVYPPSAGAFQPTIANLYIKPVLEFLSETGAPFLHLQVDRVIRSSRRSSSPGWWGAVLGIVAIGALNLCNAYRPWVEQKPTFSYILLHRMGETKGSFANACLALCFATTLFLALDPFRLSIIGNDPNFIAKHVKQPKLSQLSFPRDGQNKLQRARKWSADGLMGPESLAIDPHGKGPYTGVADGRIMRWDGPQGGWQEFAYTSANRSSAICEPGQPLSQVIRNEHVCGRPLGLRFDRKTGNLYIADAYFGLLSVGPEGGQAKRLVTQVEGLPLSFTNDLDVASDGSVYFTDSSSKYERRNFFLLVLSGDDSGRLLKYDPKTKETSVVLRGLQFPNGVALSKDESFLVIAESVPGRLLRHWLKGAQAGQTEVMAVLPGYPDNVRVNEEGDFWVAMHCRRNLASMISGALPWLRRAFLQLPIPFKHVYRIFNGGPPHGIVAKYSGRNAGEVVEVLEDVEGSVVKYASEVDERDGRLWVGSVLLPYIAVYDLHSSS